MTEKDQPGLKICVVSCIPPVNILVYQFVQVLEPTIDELVLITGNYPEKDVFSQKIKLVNLVHDNKKQPFIIRAFKFVLLQMKFSWNLVKNLPKTKIVVFFLEGSQFLFPMLTARLAGRKTIIVITHSSPQIVAQTNKNKFLPLIVSILETINRELAHKLVVYSLNMCRQFKLEKYKNKIYIAHEHFLDFDEFKIKKKFNERDNLVGYIGRLSEEKGTLNFVKAIPMVLEKENKITFLVGGDGQLRDEIERYISEENLEDKVKLVGWIPHDEVPEHLNELKLLVIPSYTESGPIIALEAMACGTPILATQVGHVLNMIEDGETGFIMENNSPECIAENIKRALAYSSLDKIVKNARELVEGEFTYEAAVERYRVILEQVGG